MIDGRINVIWNKNGIFLAFLPVSLPKRLVASRDPDIANKNITFAVWSYVRTNAITQGCWANNLAVVCKRMQQLPTMLGLDFLKVLRFSFPVPVVGPLLSLAFGGENIKNLPSRALALALSLLPQKHTKSTARASRSWKNLSSTRRQVYVGTWSASWEGYNPLILWRPCVMRERGPYNVRRAVQTDPTLLRHAVRRSRNKKNVGSCWFKSLTGCKQCLFFVSFLTHFVWQTIVIHHQLLVKRIRHTT